MDIHAFLLAHSFHDFVFIFRHFLKFEDFNLFDTEIIWNVIKQVYDIQELISYTYPLRWNLKSFCFPMTPISLFTIKQKHSNYISGYKDF